ncbi:MAG: PilZ domain-containing protein [Alkalispirochaeta sp.]
MESSLAAGFDTPLIEMIAVLVVVAGVIVAFVGYYLRRRNEEQRRHAREDAQRYHELVHLSGLTPSEESVVGTLVQHLRRHTPRHVLLQNQGVFNQAATVALDDGEVSPGQISALRVKLGFTGKPVGMRPRSSVDLPAGAALLIQKPRRAPVHGQVIEAQSDALRVRLDGADTPLTDGSLVHVVYQNDAGVFEFDSGVLLRDGDEVQLQHAEEISGVQLRSHFRREIRIPVYVSSATCDEEAALSQFIDIGGGGASLENPGKRFSAGDTVELTFHPDGDRALNLIATVVRTSRSGSVLHVKYGSIRESSRDRVYRLLFNPPESE